MHWNTPPRLALHSWTLDTMPLPIVLAVAKQAEYDAVELRWIDFRRCFEQGSSAFGRRHGGHHGNPQAAPAVKGFP